MKRLGLGAMALVLLACGGGGGLNESADETISGIVNTDTFEVPSGKTVQVVGDLEVNASSDILINGKLVINAGVQVELIAQGDITVAGEVAGGPEAAGSRNTGPYNTIMMGQRVQIAGPTRPGSGSNLVIACPRNGGEVIVTAPISLPKGRDARNKSEAGQNGGAILIGSTSAIQTLESRKAVVPNTVTIAANIKAGDGGHGADDLRGRPEKRQIVLEPSSGGYGGDIQIFATGGLTIGTVTITPGAGGSAGWAGRVRGASTGVFEAPDSNETQVPGFGVACVLGRPGDAGAFTFGGSPVSNAGTEKRSLAGRDASIFVKPGRGGPEASGGDVSISGGLIKFHDSKGAAMAPSMIVEVRGGHGGRGSIVNAGGAGGTFFAGAVSDRFADVFFVDALRGGDGFNGCEVSDTQPGTDGGPGGTHNLPWLPTISGRSMNGGDGGSYGNNFGTKGGAAGTNGRAGLPGRPCAETKFFLSLDNEVKLADGLVLAKGTKVSLVRVRGGSVGGPEAGCEHEHLHGSITIDGYGPIPDPNPMGCGHGQLSLN